jgi:signal transduction histidine kinase
MKYCFAMIVFLAGMGSLRSQTKIIDSLVHQIGRARSPAEQLRLLAELWQHQESIRKDSLWSYQQRMQQLALQEDDRQGQTLAAIAAIDASLRWDRADSAATLIESWLPKTPLRNPLTRSAYFRLSERKAACMIASGADYQSATALLLTILSQAEQFGDSLATARTMNQMCACTYNLNNLPASIEWGYRGLQYCGESPDYATPKSALCINLAAAYAWIEKYDSAQYFLDKAILLCGQTENMYYLANAYLVQTNLFKWTKRFPEAEACMLKAIKLRESTEGDLTFSNEQLALGNLYNSVGKYYQAVEVYKAGIDYAEKIKASRHSGKKINYDLLQYYYEGIARAYKAIGNTEEYQGALRALIDTKDSFYTINSTEAIAELQTRYEVKKKEATIAEQRLDIARKNNILLLSISIAFAAGITSWFLFRGYREKKKREMTTAIEAERSLAAKAVADAEENERKRIAADLHDNLGAYAASIASNIDVLQSEKAAGLNQAALQELNSNSQSMVAQLSDTIWALNKDALRLTAISDRVKVFLNRIRRSYNDIDMEVLEDIKQDISLPPTQAFHLFRIIQEAVANAVKHSGSNRIEIAIEGNDGWKVTVTDFGKGMNPLSPRPGEGGNGLRNMQARSAVSGWNISWQANNPSGTVVSIYPETKQN